MDGAVFVAEHNALLRHLVDGFVVRGEMANAWKLLVPSEAAW